LADVKALEALVEPIANAMGLDLVRVLMLGGPGGPTLQIMAEDPATRQLTIGQCTRLSRQVSVALDEADPIESEYSLEVSSPGIDRPLTRLSDFADWAGHVAKLQAEGGETDRKRYQGRLRGIDGDMVCITVDDLGDVSLPFASLTSAKLVLTDELIKATRPLIADGADEIIEEEDED
jgi:ribosome maturation factor RimP